MSFYILTSYFDDRILMIENQTFPHGNLRKTKMSNRARVEEIYR